MSLIDTMQYLDADMAVRGFLAELIGGIASPISEGGQDYNIEVVTEWPTNLNGDPKAVVFIKPLEVGDNTNLGNGDSVDLTDDEFEVDTILVSHGAVKVPFTIICFVPSRVVRDKLLYLVRQIIYLNPQTKSLAGYFNQPVSIELESYKRIEDEETTLANMFVFEVSGFGITNDVMLEPLVITEVSSEITIL